MPNKQNIMPNDLPFSLSVLWFLTGPGGTGRVLSVLGFIAGLLFLAWGMAWLAASAVMGGRL